jgi:hypothetical protein
VVADSSDTALYCSCFASAKDKQTSCYTAMPVLYAARSVVLIDLRRDAEITVMLLYYESSNNCESASLP